MHQVCVLKFNCSVQVVDQGIVSSGFNVICLTPLMSCQVSGNSVTQRTVLVSCDDDFQGGANTFSVAYSYGSCVNSAIETTLTGITTSRY